MIITKEWLEKGMYQGCGIKKAQCKILGIPYPLKQGWKEKIIGEEISSEQAEEYRLLGQISRKEAKKYRVKNKAVSKHPSLLTFDDMIPL